MTNKESVFMVSFPFILLLSACTYINEMLDIFEHVEN